MARQNSDGGMVGSSGVVGGRSVEWREGQSNGGGAWKRMQWLLVTDLSRNGKSESHKLVSGIIFPDWAAIKA